MEQSRPVDSNGHEREDARRDSTGSDELSEAAVSAPERPVVVDHIHEVKQRVEDGNERVGNSEVYQEVVNDSAHALVRDHDPDDNSISAGGDNDDEDEHDDVDELYLPAERVLRRVARR